MDVVLQLGDSLLQLRPTFRQGKSLSNKINTHTVKSHSHLLQQQQQLLYDKVQIKRVPIKLKNGLLQFFQRALLLR